MIEHLLPYLKLLACTQRKNPNPLTWSVPYVATLSWPFAGWGAKDSDDLFGWQIDGAAHMGTTCPLPIWSPYIPFCMWRGTDSCDQLAYWDRQPDVHPTSIHLRTPHRSHLFQPQTLWKIWYGQYWFRAQCQHHLLEGRISNRGPNERHRFLEQLSQWRTDQNVVLDELLVNTLSSPKTREAASSLLVSAKVLLQWSCSAL